MCEQWQSQRWLRGAPKAWVRLRKVVCEVAQAKRCDQTHLMGSIERRGADVGGIFIDANNEKVVSYVNRFLLIGDAGQQ